MNKQQISALPYATQIKIYEELGGQKKAASILQSVLRRQLENKKNNVIFSPTSTPTSSPTQSPMMQQSARLSSAASSPGVVSRASSRAASRAASSPRITSERMDGPILNLTKSERQQKIQQSLKANAKLQEDIDEIEDTKKIVKKEIDNIKKTQTASAGVLRKFIDLTFYKIPTSINEISNDINKLQKEKIELNDVLINILEAQKRIQVDIEKQGEKVKYIDDSRAAAKIDTKVAQNKNVLAMILADINGVEARLINIDRQIEKLKQFKQQELKNVMEKNELERKQKEEAKRDAKEKKENQKRKQDALDFEIKLEQTEMSIKEKTAILQEQKVYSEQLSQYLSGFNGSNPIISKYNTYKALYEIALKERGANTVGITGRLFKTKEAQKEMNYRYEIANINSKAYYANMKLFENLLKDKQKFIRNHYAKIMNQISVAKMKETEKLLKIKDAELIDNLYTIPRGFDGKEGVNETRRINDLRKNEDKEKERLQQESIANAMLMEKAKQAEKDARNRSMEVNDRLFSAEANKAAINDKVKEQVISERINMQRASLTEAERLKLREQAARPVFNVKVDKVEAVKVDKVEAVRIPNPNTSSSASSAPTRTSRRITEEIISPQMTSTKSKADIDRMQTSFNITYYKAANDLVRINELKEKIASLKSPAVIAKYTEELNKLKEQYTEEQKYYRTLRQELIALKGEKQTVKDYQIYVDKQ